MDKSIAFSKSALSSATALLAAQWIVALASIPSAQDYANQIADGKSPEDITTLYDNLTILIFIFSIWSYIATNRLLKFAYDRETKVNPTAVRLKSVWIYLGWITPVVSFWFPKRIVDDLVEAKSMRTGEANPVGKNSMTWWTTWVSHDLINALGFAGVALGTTTRIEPTYQLAAAAMLTASYLVWTKILKALAE